MAKKRIMNVNLGPFKLNSLKIAEILLIFGIPLLTLSVFLSSQPIAFIGLGLTFWGSLFMLITPQKHVNGSLLEITVLPEYLTIDRILNELKPKGEAFCIPPIPKDVTLPEHLKGLKEMVVFVPSEEVHTLTSIEELAKSNFQNKKPKGILLSPPGLGILDKIEQKQKSLGILDKIEQKQNTNMATIPLNDLVETLPELLGELNFSKEITITNNGNETTLQIKESLYAKLYNQNYNLRSIRLLGCPLVNAVACALAKSSGKSVTLQKLDISPDGKIITATFKAVQL
jgi:hypothetical protein